MYLTPDIIRAQERRFGTPLAGAARAEFAPPEFALLQHCLSKNRATT